MNIQRKYSLPNCTLLLEGLSDVTRAAHFQELRPELSILVNAECCLSGYQPLAGGREFFESLVRAVSGYAQEFLSSVPNPQAHNQESELVEFQKISSNRHRLIVYSEGNPEGFKSNPHSYAQRSTQLDLNTVQLFDLIEAVDQFFADTQTLPELSLELQPVTRRYGGASQVLLKQAVPATIGVSSLAVAAIAFNLIPPPQVRPQPQTGEQTSSTTPITTPSAASNQQTSSTTPNPISSPASTTAAAIGKTTPIAAPTPTPTPTTNTTPVVKDLEALLKTVPEITDASQLHFLKRQLWNQIHPAWINRSQIKQDLVYRVGVAADGAIVGYKAVNEAANEAIDQTPLPNLLHNPVKRALGASEPIAQFRVVFTRRGVPEVSPWLGYTGKPDVIGSKITDANTIKSLNQKLYSTVRQRWGGTPSFTGDLRYRVAVNKDGKLADYETLNPAAYDYAKQTPLPKLYQEIYGSNVAAANNKEPLAHFQVIFKPSGKLEVTPWRGYQ